MPHRNPPHLGALLFDLDGTLVDSRSDFQDALSQVLSRYERTLSPEEYAYTIGHSWEDIYQFLSKRAQLPMPLSVLEEEMYQTRLKKAQDRKLTALPGVVDGIRRLSEKVPCALVTGSSRKEAEMIIDSLRIAEHFRFLICAGEATRGKPAPDPYLLAAQKLAVSPSICGVLEDSTVGIAAAKAAGMFCIAIRAGNFANQDQSQAHHIVDTLSEFEGWFFEKAYQPKNMTSQ